MESSPLIYPKESVSPDCEPGSTPRWASQRLYSSPRPTHFLTARHKNFTSPSLRSLAASQFSPLDSYTDLRSDSRTEQSNLTETSILLNVLQQRGTKPPPRPPRYSKSLGHIPKVVDQDQHPKRRRSVATCKSTHSLFECSEGCFDVEGNKPRGQLVTITTGPVVC